MIISSFFSFFCWVSPNLQLFLVNKLWTQISISPHPILPRPGKEFNQDNYVRREFKRVRTKILILLNLCFLYRTINCALLARLFFFVGFHPTYS